MNLPPLSSSWACRVKWFDNMGNSLGFSTELNEDMPLNQMAPSHQVTPPTTYPSHFASSHESPASPPSPSSPPPIFCARFDENLGIQSAIAIIQDLIFEVQRDLEDFLFIYELQE
jgi:hypothetical protein